VNETLQPSTEPGTVKCDTKSFRICERVQCLFFHITQHIGRSLLCWTHCSSGTHLSRIHPEFFPHQNSDTLQIATAKEFHSQRNWK